MAATQISKITKNVLLNTINNENLNKILDNEFGMALMHTVLGMIITNKFGNNEKYQKIAEEFRVSGMTSLGNSLFEVLNKSSPELAEAINQLPQEIDNFNVEEFEDILQEELHYAKN
ncbi:MAG: hypothetical protein LC122_11730 [Chitinophagales bacterium]|nr:hypothetical protein [Chitinophagales bacterium]